MEKAIKWMHFHVQKKRAEVVGGEDEVEKQQPQQ